MAERGIGEEVDVTQIKGEAVFRLTARLDHDALSELGDFVAASRGSAVRIDGATADQIGAQAAQILAVARLTWAADGVPFEIDDPAGAVAASLDRLGLSDLLSHPSMIEGAPA